MADFSKEFGNNLRDLIKKRGLTQEQFASAMDISLPGLNHFLKGRVPDGLRLKRFADELGVTMEELLTGEKAEGRKAPPPEMEKVMAILERGDPGDIGYLRGVIDTEYRKIEEKEKEVKRGA